MRAMQHGRTQDGNQALGLVSADIGAAAAIIVQGCCLDAVDSPSPLHVVKVELQDAVFGHDDLHDHRRLRFQILAQIVPVCREEDGACCLVADGAGSEADASCLLVSLPSLLDLREFKAPVLVKIAIFQSDHHLLCGRRDVFKRHVISFVPIISPDQVSLEHERRDGWIDEGVEQAERSDYAPITQVQK